MHSLTLEEVFTPNGFPTHTYVERDGKKNEGQVALGLKMIGLVSIAGPSKSGKTVLAEKVVTASALLTIAGGTISTAADLWNQVLQRTKTPGTTTTGSATSVTGSASTSAKGEAKILGTGVEGGGGLQIGGSQGWTQAQTFSNSGYTAACDALRAANKVLLVDDFHYIPKAVQTELSNQFKEITRRSPGAQNTRIIVALVPHRADDPVRANPDLRGRICTVDLEYWSTEDLEQIAKKGMEALNIEIPRTLIRRLAEQAAGSPQLMQTLCFTMVSALEISSRQPHRQTLKPNEAVVLQALTTTATMNDSRTLIKKLDDGRMTRGKERATLSFRDGTTGDVYTCILRALAMDPPALDFDAANLRARISDLCTTSPAWQNVINTIGRMREIADEVAPQTIDWDGDQLSLLDPHILFYLRWCGDYRKPRLELLAAPPVRRSPKA